MTTTTAKAFGTVLSRIREEQGFSSAFQFFKSIGGSKSLGFAFVSYWDIERGKKLPKIWRLKAIMAALGLENHSAKVKELVGAYLKALSGSDELGRILSAPAPSGADLPGTKPAEAAIQKALATRSVNLTLDQWKLRSRDMVTNICQNFLSNTDGWVTVRELANATKFQPEAIKKALKALAAGKLVELSGDRARSPFAGKVIKTMPMTPETARIKAAQLDHWKLWLADSKLIDAKRMTVRMTKASLDIYRQHMEKTVNLATVYDNAGEDRQNSAIYYIDASIFQVLPRV